MNISRLFALIPYLLLIASGLVIAGLLAVNMHSLLIRSLIILIPCIFGSIFIIIFKKKSIISFDSIYALPFSQNRLRKYFGIAAVAIFILLILGGYNSLIYLGLLILLYLLTIFQILTKKPSAGYCLFSIIYTSAILILPLVLSQAYYYDGSDIIFHTNGVLYVVNNGTISPHDFQNIYSVFCGLYVLIGSASMLTSIVPHTVLYIVFTIFCLGISPVVYLLSKQLFHSEQISLLAVCFYLIIPTTLEALTSFAPFFLASQLLVILLYLIMRDAKGKTILFTLISLPIVISTIYAHHAEHLPMLFIVTFILAVSILLRFIVGKKLHQNIINIPIIILYVASVLAYLYYTYIYSTMGYILKAFRRDDSNTLSSLTLSIDSTEFDVVFTYISSIFVSLSVFFILISLYVLIMNASRNPIEKQKQYLFAIIILVFFIFYIPGVVNSLPGLSALNTYRWRPILALYFSIATAVGIGIFAGYLQSCTKKYFHLGAVITVIVCLILLINPIMMFSADNAVFDNAEVLDVIHKSPANTANEYFDEKDIAMFITLTGRLTDGNTFTADMDSSRYVLTYVSPNVNSTQINPLLLENLFDTKEIDEYQYVIFRDEYFSKRDFKYVGGSSYNKLPDNQDTRNMFNYNIKSHNLIYKNSGDIVYYF